MICKQTQTKLI